MYKILFLSFVFIFNLYGANLLPTLPAQKEESPPYIKVSEVSSSAIETTHKLKEASKLIQIQENIATISKDLKSHVKAIDTLLNDSTNLYLKYSSLKLLTQKEQELSIRINQLKKWNLVLQKRTKDFDENKIHLEKILTKWQETLKNARKNRAPKIVINNILSIIKTTQELQFLAKKRYDKILTDSNHINKKILQLSDILDKTLEAKVHVSRELLQKNALSLWTLFHENSFAPLSYVKSTFLSMKEEFKGLIDFYKVNDNKVLLFTLYSLFILSIVAVFNYLYRKKRLFVHKESYLNSKYLFIASPISTGILLLFLLNFFMFSNIPLSVRHFQLLAIVLPVLLILKKSMPTHLDKYFYFLMLLYALSIVEKYASGFDLDARIFSIFITLSLSVYLVALIKNRILNTFFAVNFLKFAYIFFNFLLLLLVISLFADIYGATLLAAKITSAIMTALYSALIFYVMTMILTAYIIIFLRRRIASASLEIERFTLSLEKTMTFLIKLFMSLWFVKILLSGIGIWTYVIKGKDSIISLSWQVGQATISLESLFDFFMIIVGTWLLLRVINIVLEVEVFAHFKFPRGIPTAIVTVLNYIFTIVGLLIAFSSLGITIEQFTLIFGALGVGIGFGIRNIIANFISGIIMVFERPIQIGDTIEINQTMGTVQAIKTRSSIIKTFDGSEVIIPNADFIAKEITNWTLSDERRRKTLIFKVDMQSDIDTVLEIMKSVVNAHPNVLHEPEPMATFVSFGEYYFEFKLYFWLNENLIMAQSEIAVEIYKTLKSKGIKMPTPKNEFLEIRESKA